MAQYQVPQFIDIEDRIIGPLTLKQFMYLAFAGAILFVFWFLFKFYIWVIVALPITAAALAFAFVKINDRPFIYFFLAAVFYFMKPKLYIFGAAPEAPRPEAIPEKPSEPSFAKPARQLAGGAMEGDGKITRSRLKELALSLDTRK